MKYINTSFENASQLDWEVDSDGVVNVSLIYDHERSSPNRANGHWYFQIQAEPGSDLTPDFKKLRQYMEWAEEQFLYQIQQTVLSRKTESTGLLFLLN